MSTPATDPRTLQRLRSALLNMTTAVAEATTEPAVARAIVDGLTHDVFGFDRVTLSVSEAGASEPVLAVSSNGGSTDGGSEQPAKMALPLRIGDSVVGELEVERPAGAIFDRGDVELLTACARQAGAGLARTRHLAGEQRRVKEQQALLDTLADLSSQLEIEQLLQAVLERAVTLLGVTGGELAVYNEGEQLLTIVASHNMGTGSVGTRMQPGEGAMGHVALSQEPLIIPNYQRWSGRSSQYTHDTVQAVIVAPLLIGDRLVGAIAAVHSDPSWQFGEADLRLLELFAPQAAIAIENARLFAAERRRSEEQKALLDTMTDLVSNLELEKVLHRVLERAVTLLGVTGGELAIFDGHHDDLEVVASMNIGTDSVGTRMSLGEGAMGRVAETHEPLIIPNYQEWEGRSDKYTQSTVQAVMAAPLLIGQRLVGAIASVHSDPTRRFGEEDLRLLELFAPQAAIAIENARLFAASQRYYKDLVLNNPVAIVNLDLDAKITACNPAFEELFGYTEAEVIGRNLDELVTTEDLLGEAATYTERSLSGVAARGSGQRVRKDGTLVDVEIFSIPVMIGDEPVGMMALYHDITELLEARQAAESANQA
ncbi:MAG: GAF domain-containing protein, partial [Gemmatimonadota bacterium]